MMELEESVFAPEILYKISFYPLKRPKDNHKLKTTPLELRNLTISRNHSHQSKLSLSFGDKKKKLIQISEVAVSDCTIFCVLFNHSEVQSLYLLNKDVNAKLIQ